LVNHGLPISSSRLEREKLHEFVDIEIPDESNEQPLEFQRRFAVSLSVRAVERALDILLCFTAEEPVRSLTQIAGSVHLSKPTVHRLLATLEKKRFIAKDQATSQYRLGIHGQLDSSRGLSIIQSHEKALNESGRGLKINTPNSNAVPVFVAAGLPKDPPTSTGFRSVGTNP
jgi:hypothetical protein